MIAEILDRLPKVKSTGRGTWIACCPAHQDKSPSMTLRETDDGRILAHCFAGCSIEAIVNAVGLGWEPWFPPKSDDDFKPPIRRPFPAQDVMQALSFEMTFAATAAAAMARGEQLSDADRQRLMLAHERISAGRDLAI